MMLAGADATGGSGLMAMVFPFIAMFAIFYFLLIRPQQKKQKQRNSMLSALQKGDKIVTIGGLHGTIVEMTDDVVRLRVNDVMEMSFDRNAISSIVSNEEALNSSS